MTDKEKGKNKIRNMLTLEDSCTARKIFDCIGYFCKLKLRIVKVHFYQSYLERGILRRPKVEECVDRGWGFKMENR